MTITGASHERSPVTLEKGENVICMSCAGFARISNANASTVEQSNSSDRSTDEFTWTEEEETAVRRKLDRVIVPLTTFLYLLCFLDR
jgi:hypothetical protein